MLKQILLLILFLSITLSTYAQTRNDPSGLIKSLEKQVNAHPTITVPVLTQLFSYNSTQFKKYLINKGFTYNSKEESYERQTQVDYLALLRSGHTLVFCTDWFEDYDAIKKSLPKMGYKYLGKIKEYETYKKGIYTFELKNNDINYFIFLKDI